MLLASLVWAEIRERPANWATPMLSEHLENFYRLDAKVYRAAQPDAEGMRELAAHGFREILNLRQFHDDEDEAASTGLVLHRVAANAATIADAEVVTALKILKNAQGPVLIHCWHGSDRTGLISAMYRIVFQNWSKAEAVEELQRGGYGYHKLYRNIPAYILNVDAEKIRRAVCAED